jgi:hypothetical protein
MRRRQAPRQRRGEVMVLDNLKAHKAPKLRTLIEQRGVLALVAAVFE